jgi:predicted dehydrogenase
MQTINWGIIGCGDVTEVKSGPAFNKVPHSKLVAVMRRNAQKAEDYARRHAVPRWYDDTQQLIDDGEVNAIYVATPPLFHEEYAVKAMAAGKPVYVEKPMATDASSAQRVSAFSDQSGVKLTVAHYRRQQPLFLKIKALLENKVIGNVRAVDLRFAQPHLSDMIAKTEVNWRIDPMLSGGGLFHDLAPHQLDLMFYFFGSIKKANGLSSNTGGFYEADDTVAGQAIFENDIFFTGSWCFAAKEKTDRCIISGTTGEIRFSVFEHQPLSIIKNSKEELLSFDKLEHVQQPMIEKTVRYFMGQSPNPCSASEGIEVMRLIDAFTKK